MAFPCTNQTWLSQRSSDGDQKFFGHQLNVWIVDNQKNAIAIPQVWRQPKINNHLLAKCPFGDRK
jgi:hypothetical protein